MNSLIKIPYICGLGLSFKLDNFRLIYSAIAVLMWTVTALFSKEYFKNHKNHIKRYCIFTVLTFLSITALFFSTDFFTAFIFFEIMSLSSYVWVVHNEDTKSLDAGDTYMAVAIIGGLVMLMGIFLLYSVTGTLDFDELSQAYIVYGVNSMQRNTQIKLYASGICILFGFAAKAGAFPVHIWLPKAHPVAPAPASALLSGILTKAGIFGIIVLSMYVFYGVESWGAIVLITGVLTMLAGAILALFSVDLKRTLACSSVSQIGFILVGIGMAVLQSFNGLTDGSGFTEHSEPYTAINGAFMHMVNHSLIKLVLFCAAGVIFMNVKKLDLNDIRGFGRGKRLLNIIFLSGALSISGVPFFSGYVSKTLIHESIIHYKSVISSASILSKGAVNLIETLFIISGGLTFAYMTKLYVCIFIEKNADDSIQEKYDSMNGKYMSRLTSLALLIPAAILLVFGFIPKLSLFKLYTLSSGFLRGGIMPQIKLLSLENLTGAAYSLITGAIVYLIIVRGYMMSRVPVNELGIEDLEASVSGIYTDLRNDKNEPKNYVNRWNKYLDIENIIYRPLLLSFIPFVFGVICRFLDCIIDYIVVALRKTVYKDSKLPQELYEGNIVTYTLARLFDFVRRIKNKTVNKDDPEFKDYEHIFAMRSESVEESLRIVARSLSFGLVLFCIGLLLTVSYILFVKV